MLLIIQSTKFSNIHVYLYKLRCSFCSSKDFPAIWMVLLLVLLLEDSDYQNRRFAWLINVALTPYKGIISSCHEGIKTILLSSVHYIYRIILLTLSNLDEYILHRQILSRNIYICTMGCDLNSLLYYYSN